MSKLSRLTARDLMQVDVVRFSPTTPLETAMEMLEEYHIGGAPVVDESEHVVGVLSTHDVARSQHVHTSRTKSALGGFEMAEPGDEEWTGEPVGEDVYFSKESYSQRVLAGDSVADWMTPQVISVDPDATLSRICKTMVDNSIHRVLVVKGKSLKGIVTSFDVVRCVAESI